MTFGGLWYAWNTYYNEDDAMGVIFAANTAWALNAGPICKYFLTDIKLSIFLNDFIVRIEVTVLQSKKKFSKMRCSLFIV